MNGKMVWVWIGITVLLMAVTAVTTRAIISPVILAPNAPPWWGIPLFTIAGGVAGACLSGGFMLVNEYQKREAEAVKADSQLEREAGLKVLIAVGEYFEDTRNGNLDMSKDQLTPVMDMFRFAADPDLFERAQRFKEAATFHRQIQHIAATNPQGMTNEIYQQALPTFYHHRARFINGLREQYGIKQCPNRVYYQKPQRLPDKKPAMVLSIDHKIA